jgi:TatD DNase family protein
MSAQGDSERRPSAARRAGDFPPPPEPLPAPVLDSHTHLDHTLRDAMPTIDAAADAARLVGVDRLVQVGADLASSRWTADVAVRHHAVLGAVALHPNEAPRLSNLDEALREIEALAQRDRIRAVGETGLDYFRTGEEGRKAQHESFRAHIAIAKRHGKALVIHDRDAHLDVLKVLDEEGAPEHTVMHCFSGDAEFARQCVRRGLTLSFAGTVTFGNAHDLREAAKVTPLDLMLVETDAPYLTPMPYRGRPNASYLIPLTVRALAEATGVDLAELCAALSANGERIFGAW